MKQIPNQQELERGSPYKVSVEALIKLVEEAGSTFELTRLLGEVRKDIGNGADLKVSPDYVLQRSKNAESAIQKGTESRMR